MDGMRSDFMYSLAHHIANSVPYRNTLPIRGSEAQLVGCLHALIRAGIHVTGNQRELSVLSKQDEEGGGEGGCYNGLPVDNK